MSRSSKRIDPFLNYIRDEWKKNPDERFGQLLINLGLIEDNLIDWKKEENEHPIPHKYLREIQHWGTYGKKGYKEVSIKDLTENHIKMILKTQNHINENLKELLKYELKYKGGKK